MQWLLARQTQRAFWFHILFPVLFLGIVLLFLPLEQVFQFDQDEGLEVIKAALYLQGYELYDQIWNDQPPLLTCLLAGWFTLFGKSVLAARLLILSFATLLLWSFCQILRLYVGSVAATLGGIALFLAQDVVFLSISVMFGLPAIALAMLSIYLVLLYQQKSNPLLLLASGCLFALSLQTKLFTAPLIVIVLLQIIVIGAGQKPGREGALKRLSAAGLWFLTCATVFLAIGVFLRSLRPDQLLSANLDANVRAAFSDYSNWQMVLHMLVSSGLYVLLGLLGLWIMARQHRLTHSAGYLFPLAWLAVVLPVMLYHQPLWYHYSILLSIPIIWLAAYGFEQLLEGQKSQSRGQKMVARILLVFLCLVATKRLVDLHHTGVKYTQRSQPRQAVAEQVAQHQASTRWFFTDMPMYAFRVGLNVPPEIAVFSRKRLYAGNLSVPQLCSLIRRYHPEQLLLGRFPKLDSQLQSCLWQFPYQRKVYQVDQNQQFIHYVLQR